jgi:3-methyladenine DNA glycosylase AlkD
MQAYMKSEMPFLGVQKPERARAIKPVLRSAEFADGAGFADALKAVWDAAKYREERYAVLAVARDRRQAAHRAELGMEVLPLYEHFIVTGAWWDLVDETAIKLVGELLGRKPKETTRALRAWAKDADLWKRRTSIIAQVGRKDAVDRRLLTHCIDVNSQDANFFIRKGIGWALRDLAWTDPSWVRAFVEARADRLSPLSKREALKNIGRPRR